MNGSSVISDAIRRGHNSQRPIIINNYLSLGEWELARAAILSALAEPSVENFYIDISHPAKELKCSLCEKCIIILSLRMLVVLGPPPSLWLCSASIPSSAHLSYLCLQLLDEICQRYSNNTLSPCMVPAWVRIRVCFDVLLSDAILCAHPCLTVPLVNDIREAFCTLLYLRIYSGQYSGRKQYKASEWISHTDQCPFQNIHCCGYKHLKHSHDQATSGTCIQQLCVPMISFLVQKLPSWTLKPIDFFSDTHRLKWLFDITTDTQAFLTPVASKMTNAIFPSSLSGKDRKTSRHDVSYNTETSCLDTKMACYCDIISLNDLIQFWTFIPQRYHQHLSDFLTCSALFGLNLCTLSTFTYYCCCSKFSDDTIRSPIVSYLNEDTGGDTTSILRSYVVRFVHDIWISQVYLALNLIQKQWNSITSSSRESSSKYISLLLSDLTYQNFPYIQDTWLIPPQWNHDAQLFRLRLLLYASLRYKHVSTLCVSETIKEPSTVPNRLSGTSSSQQAELLGFAARKIPLKRKLDVKSSNYFLNFLPTKFTAKRFQSPLSSQKFVETNDDFGIMTEIIPYHYGIICAATLGCCDSNSFIQFPILLNCALHLQHLEQKKLKEDRINLILNKIYSEIKHVIPLYAGLHSQYTETAVHLLSKIQEDYEPLQISPQTLSLGEVTVIPEDKRTLEPFFVHITDDTSFTQSGLLTHSNVNVSVDASESLLWESFLSMLSDPWADKDKILDMITQCSRLRYTWLHKNNTSCNLALWTHVAYNTCRSQDLFWEFLPPDIHWIQYIFNGIKRLSTFHTHDIYSIKDIQLRAYLIRRLLMPEPRFLVCFLKEKL